MRSGRTWAESQSASEQMLMTGIKQVFDPLNILNPSKVITPLNEKDTIS